MDNLVAGDLFDTLGDYFTELALEDRCGDLYLDLDVKPFLFCYSFNFFSSSSFYFFSSCSFFNFSSSSYFFSIAAFYY